MNPDWKLEEVKPMKNPLLLTKEEINLFFASFPNWKLERREQDGIEILTRVYQFTTFIQAFGYLSKIALLSEKLDHHAEIYNLYGLVKLTVFTHTTKNLTHLDRLFAYQAELLL